MKIYTLSKLFLYQTILNMFTNQFCSGDYRIFHDRLLGKKILKEKMTFFMEASLVLMG